METSSALQMRLHAGEREKGAPPVDGWNRMRGTLRP
jgi:hypothetical protein